MRVPYRWLYSDEQLTIAHMAIKGKMYRFLHEVVLDEYDFDVDYYKPYAKLTLLHILAKYGSLVDW